MKNLSFTLALLLMTFASVAQVTKIAGDDFDNPLNLNDRTITVDMAFMNPGDAFGPVSPNTDDPVNPAPFALVDDTNPACPGFFQFDTQGIIPCAYTGGNFFGINDTENPNNMGQVQADWEFDISGGTVDQITIDFGAMGNYESNDVFTFEYSVDGGAYEPLFMLTADESATAEYTLFDGDVFNIVDPMTVDGTIIINGLTTFAKDIPEASGSTLSIRLFGMSNGGDDPIAFDNICLNNTTAAPIPTMGEWALFLFSLIVLTLGVVFVFNTQHQMSATNGGVSAPVKMNTLPFDSLTFATAIKHALGLAVVGFAVIYIVWGEIVPLDFIGMALSIPLVAYILHLLMMFKSK